MKKKIMNFFIFLCLILINTLTVNSSSVTPVGSTIDKYALAVACVHSPENWIFKKTWGSSSLNISRLKKIEFKNATQYQEDFVNNALRKGPVDFSGYWISENPFEYFAENTPTVSSFKVFLLKFADAILEHRYSPENRANVLNAEYTSSVENMFMELIYYTNKKYDIDDVLNTSLQYCAEIKETPQNLLYAVNNLYTERLVPRLFNEDYSSDINIYGKLYLMFNGKMLNKNIIIDQTVYFIQKKFNIRVDREIIRYALDIYNYPYPYARTYDKDVYKVLDILYAGKFNLMSNTNDRDIDILTLWYTMHYEVDRKYDFYKQNETDETVNEKFQKFRATTTEVFDINLNNNPWLASQEIENINEKIIQKLKTDNNEQNVSKFIGSLNRYLLAKLRIATAKDRYYLIPMVSKYNDLLYSISRAIKAYVEDEGFYLMPIVIPREKCDLNNYLLIESINKIKFVIRELDNIDSGDIYDYVRLEMKDDSLPFANSLDPYSIFDEREIDENNNIIPDTEIPSVFNNTYNLIEYLKEILLVDIGNVDVTVFHENQIESTVYNSCQYIVTQYPEIVYAYKELRNYLIFTNNKNVAPAVNSLHSILQCLTGAEDIDYEAQNVSFDSETAEINIQLESYEMDNVLRSDINIPKSICNGLDYSICINSLSYIVSNTKMNLIKEIGELYSFLEKLTSNKYNSYYVQNILTKISGYNELSFSYNTRGTVDDQMITKYFDSNNLEGIYSFVKADDADIIANQYENSKSISTVMGEIGKMIKNNDILSDIFRKGIFIMAGNTTECSEYFSDLSEQFYNITDSENNNRKKKRSQNIDDKMQNVLYSMNQLSMFNNIAGSSIASKSNSLLKSSEYIVNKYGATKVIPTQQPDIDTSFINPDIRYVYPTNDYYQLMNRNAVKLSTNLDIVAEELLEFIENIDKEDPSEENKELKEELLSIYKNAMTMSKREDDKKEEGEEDNTMVITKKFENLGSAMESIYENSKVESMQSGYNPLERAVVNYFKTSLQAAKLVESMVKEGQMASGGVGGGYNREDAVKMLDQMSGPIAKFTKFLVKHKVRVRTKKTVNRAIKMVSLGTLDTNKLGKVKDFFFKNDFSGNTKKTRKLKKKLVKAKKAVSKARMTRS